MKLNNKALIPPVIATIGFLLSPDFYNKLPDKYSHIIAGLALIAAALFPQLMEKEDANAIQKQNEEKKDSSEEVKG